MEKQFASSERSEHQELLGAYGGEEVDAKPDTKELKIAGENDMVAQLEYDVFYLQFTFYYE